jgi:hypothetical protein
MICVYLRMKIVNFLLRWFREYLYLMLLVHSLGEGAEKSFYHCSINER